MRWNFTCLMIMLALVAQLPAGAAVSSVVLGDLSGRSEPGDQFGEVVTTGDFNGDGFADVAIGTPRKTVSGRTHAGAVTVVLGTASGLRTGNRLTFTQNDLNLGAQGAEASDLFGFRLATGDFNGDGFADLVVSAPLEDLAGNGSDNGIVDAGLVTVIPGGPITDSSRAGLDLPRARSFSQAQVGLGEQGLEANDLFGFSLAAGDLNEDFFDDLVIGSPFESLRLGTDVNGVPEAGIVTVIMGGPGNALSPVGLAPPSFTRSFSQADLLLPAEGVEPGDLFGWSLAVGNFNGDRFSGFHNVDPVLGVSGIQDLAIGTPGEDIAGAIDAGMVTVILSRGVGVFFPQPGSFIHFTQAEVGQLIEPLDRFGETLAAADANGDRRSDLVIGTPFEDLGSLWDAGAVTVVPGSSLAAGGMLLSAAVTIIEDDLDQRAELGDLFGYALAAADFDDDGTIDVAVGAPGEDVRGSRDAGLIILLFGRFGAGLREFTPVTQSDVAQSVETGDRFGWSLATGDVRPDFLGDLLIGSPGEGLAGLGEVGMVTLIY